MTTDNGNRSPSDGSSSNLIDQIDRPIFVGGTGRSGTSVTARLIAKNASIHRIPIEIRLHVDPGGLADLVEGRTNGDRFADKMRDRWYRRTTKHGQTRGLHLFVDEDDYQNAMEEFESVAVVDPVWASRQLLGNLLDPGTRRGGASRWVEMTPPNVLKMRSLAKMFPRAKFIHIYRDGRDVAHSVASMHWGPNDIADALAWWEKTFVEGLDEMRGMESDVLLLSMEDLVERNRLETAERLFDFLDEGFGPSAREYLDLEMSGDRAHIGRWCQELSSAARHGVNTEYNASLDRIRAQFPSVGLRL